MKKSFLQSSYLSQVRQLRNLAKEALPLFPISVRSVHFINHGENATFRIQSKDGKTFMLRIHRNDYHTKDAIQEELGWLDQLSKVATLEVPRPVRSKRRNFVELVKNENFSEGRHCCLFKWIHGVFLRKSLTPYHMEEIGALIAKIQSVQPKGGVKYRRYWDAEGLVGPKPKFGSMDQLPGITKAQQKVLTAARKRTYKKLKAFEKKYPRRMGLIHADLHFSNALQNEKGLAAIDFDDSGFGFYAYDLVIPILSMESILGEKRKTEIPAFRQALMKGYSSKISWDKDDEKILEVLIAARKLLMVGWLQSRSDNPRLLKYFREHLKNVVAIFKKELKG